MKFKPGWYIVNPYHYAHYFMNDKHSICNIESREEMKKADKGSDYCGWCQNGTGKKP